MSLIRSFFTQSKSWMLFVFLFLIPFILNGGLMLFTVATLLSQPDEENAAQLLDVWGPIMALGVGLPVLGFLGWLWACGVELRQRLTPSPTSPSYLFHAALLFTSGFLIANCLLLASLFSSDPPPSTQLQHEPVLGFIAVSALVYCYWFVARNLHQAERQQNPQAPGVFANLVWVWIFPIGIFLLQPRINKITANVRTDGTTEAPPPLPSA
jgi:hypothetical protein